jgi:MOSC domain-containing protein YiiM
MKPMSTLEGRVAAVCVGAVRALTGLGRVHQTAFVKQPVAGPVALTTVGLEGDEHIYHAHGGVDQALLVYSSENYAFWRDDYLLDLPAAGAFGENLTVEGLTESAVCIGDTFHIGEVAVQITSPRAPCYKIGVRYGNRDLPVVMQDAGIPGYLLRVLIEGTVAAGDTMVLVDRPHPTMTVREAARVVTRDRDDWEVVERLVAIPELAAAMRTDLQARVADRVLEPADARLFGEGEGVPVD